MPFPTKTQSSNQKKLMMYMHEPTHTQTQLKAPNFNAISH